MATTAMRSDSECATRTSISPLSSSWASSNGRDRTVAQAGLSWCITVGPPCPPPALPRHSRAPPSTLEHPPLGGDGRWKRPVPHPDVDEHIASRPDWPETQVEIEPLCCRTNRSGVQVGSCVRLPLQMPAHGVEPFRGQASCDHRPFVDRGHSLAWFTKAV